MKKMIVLVGLIMSANVFAGEIVKMQMQDFVTTDMDYVYEVKNNKFDKVLVDCQSLRMGMSFSNGGVMASDIYLNMNMCDEMVDFLYQSKLDNLPVCIGLDVDNQEILISRETDECI